MMKMNALGMIRKIAVAWVCGPRGSGWLGKNLFSAATACSAEALHREACAAKVLVSVATVYNTLNQSRRRVLLREVAMKATAAF